MYRFTAIVFSIIVFLSLPTISMAQSSVEVHCGDIIEAELTASTRSHSYKLQVSAGTELNMGVTPIGASLNPIIFLIDQGDNLIAVVNSKSAGESEAVSNFVVSSSNPEIVVIGNDSGNTSTFYYLYEARDVSGYLGTTLGLYQLSIGCKDRQGNVINPGDNLIPPTPQPADNGENNNNPPINAPFSGFGFPGLAPVDFTNGVTIPLQVNALNIGSILTGFEGIFGFSFSAEAGQAMSLDFTRTAGNLNLGIVLLSADNQVAFQASLVTSTTLSTDLVIPVSGEYTLGVFRIDLIPPSAPENAAFTLTTTLN